MITQKKKKNQAPEDFIERAYRNIVDPGSLVAFEIIVRETDLQILASRDLSEEAKTLVLQYRAQLEDYITRHPAFLPALVPLPLDPLAPPLVTEMLRASQIAQVGPMAAVAGAIAEFVAKDLLALGSEEVIIENGGDIFVGRNRDCTVAIFAGNSPLSYRIGIRISKEKQPLGICTSSGTVGHSLSFGKADAVTVLAPSTALADAAATAIGNVVKEKHDIKFGLALAREIPDIAGVVVVKNDRFGAWGEVELVPLV